ncbi:hydroxymethylglutaryl-CoA lyase [Orrella daihaiensis]|uniref:Hydroxymethylglutaryl-CoA lyase n=1 Tax=Orrella daihaiensis TaxID=2782176 RepID=A0ABY4AQQ5_9BURK|nr:hydroxymethylglutaryl-CoA lyase [Orrella daihaiensis]UOD51385.1 hydroxymethylglutaryl-CoA lyase [Orrella daihaiensis]
MAKPRIYMHDVSPRDGFQNEAVFIETADKIAFINQLSQCGFAKIEATSFTSPKAIPALRDAEVVMHEIERVAGVEYTVLIPNVRGAERALACGIDEANLVMSVSETHNRANLRMTREQSMAQLGQIIEVLQQQTLAKPVAVNVSLSTTFGCPMEGDIAEAEVLKLIDNFARQGVRRITLCDTTGMAFPSQVRRLCRKAKANYPEVTFTLHFHNTRGLAQSNVLAAIDAGIDRFDAALGGIGGCPYAPGASGNACTEEVVHMLELEGFDTGIDLQKLLQVGAVLPSLVQHDVPSQILKAGHRLTTHPAPAYVQETGQPKPKDAAVGVIA